MHVVQVTFRWIFHWQAILCFPSNSTFFAALYVSFGHISRSGPFSFRSYLLWMTCFSVFAKYVLEVRISHVTGTHREIAASLTAQKIRYTEEHFFFILSHMDNAVDYKLIILEKLKNLRRSWSWEKNKDRSVALFVDWRHTSGRSLSFTSGLEKNVLPVFLFLFLKRQLRK